MSQTSSRGIWLSLAPLALLVVYVGWDLKTESARVEQFEAQIASLALDVEESLSGLDVRLSSLEGSTGVAERALQSPSAEQLSSVVQGLYLLETDAQYDFDTSETSEYSITHVVLEIPLGEVATKLHVGLAVSRWFPIGAYFDYDNDGLVDSDMALEFVREIPVVGGRLARSYDNDAAQNLYSILIANIESAEFTSPADLSDDAEAASNRIWTFVTNNYEAIVLWVTEATRDTRDL